MFVPKRDNLGRMKAGWLHKAFGTHVLLNVFLHISVIIFWWAVLKSGGGGGGGGEEKPNTPPPPPPLATQSTPWICP